MGCGECFNSRGSVASVRIGGEPNMVGEAIDNNVVTPHISPCVAT